MEHDATDKRHVYDALEPFLSSGATTRSYADVAKQLQMPENSLKSAVHRLGRRYGALIREEVAQTVEAPSSIDEEIRYLLSIMSK